MAKELAQISTTFPLELKKLARSHAAKAFVDSVSLSDVFELYQNAYLKVLETEKSENKKVKCENCKHANYPVNL